MNMTRRLMVKTSIAAVSLTMLDRPLQAAPTHNALPDPSKLRSGDLLWPKYFGSITLSDQEIDTEAKLLSEAIEKLRRAIPSNASPEQREAIDTLTLDQFRERYYGGHSLHQPLGAGSLSVGHVAIISLENGVPYVIEATIHWNFSGVRKLSYDEWVEDYKKRQPSGQPLEIWHARPSASLEANGEEIAQEARRYIRWPYSLANTSLEDTSSFYCSKLAYVCIRAAARDDGGVRRLNEAIPIPLEWYFPWISPRSLLEHGSACGALELINTPE